MSSTYHIVARFFVERLAPEGEEAVGTYEIHEEDVLSSSLYCDSDLDIDNALLIDEDLPKEVGVYVLLYALVVTYSQDYYGEVDVDFDVEWSKVERLSYKEAQDMFRAFTDLTEEELQKIMPDKPEPTIQLAEFTWQKR